MASFIQGEVIGPVTREAGYNADITRGVFEPMTYPAAAPTVQRVYLPGSTVSASKSGGSGEAAAREAAANAEKQRMARSLGMGAASTVLTGGTGIQDDAKTGRKKLMGE